MSNLLIIKLKRNLALSSKLLILFLITILPSSYSQNIWADQVSSTFADYQESNIKDRRVKHHDLMPLISKLKEHAKINVSEIGQSVEGREIYLVKTGVGPTTVLLWSQMHGDEPTATMAIFDFLNFLVDDDQFNKIRESIFKNLTLYFVPMLNPDGAERFMRRNAYHIDINRDALRLQSPEAQILKNIRDSLKPQYGFNLHDQNRYTSAGVSQNQATFSFLAPAYNWEKEVNDQRAEAMQLISVFNQYLQKRIPGKVGRYDDTFEPRAFGDNIQKWGTCTILIECGGYPGDREKQTIRKLHFDLFLVMAQSLINQSYQKLPIRSYFKIPMNRRYLYDLVVRKLICKTQYGEILLDLAFNQHERQDDRAKNFKLSGTLVDLGDLSTYFGYEEFNAQGYQAIPAKVVPEPAMKRDHYKSLDEQALIDQGYLYIRVASPAIGDTFKLLKPIPLASNPVSNFHLGTNPDLILIKEGKVRYLLRNGSLEKY